MSERYSEELQRKLIALSIRTVRDDEIPGVWKVVALCFACALGGFLLRGAL